MLKKTFIGLTVVTLFCCASSPAQINKPASASTGAAQNAAAQEVPATQLLKFTVHVTYMTQGGAKKTDSIAVLATTPAEAEVAAEAQFKAKNPRSTFIWAEAEFTLTDTPDRRNKPVVANAPPPDRLLKFTVHVTYMTQGGAKKTDNIAVLASTPAEAEVVAEAQFKAKNPRSTFIRAEAEFN